MAGIIAQRRVSAAAAWPPAHGSRPARVGPICCLRQLALEASHRAQCHSARLCLVAVVSLRQIRQGARKPYWTMISQEAYAD